MSSRLILRLLGLFRRSARPNFIHPLDPRDERELDLLRQRREMREQTHFTETRKDR